MQRLRFTMKNGRKPEEDYGPYRSTEHVASSSPDFLLAQLRVSMLYRISEDLIEIVVVAHQSRRPGYWQLRQTFEEDCNLRVGLRHPVVR
jgi:hypothetical protein